MQKEKLDTSLQIALEALQEGMNTNRDLLYGYDPESESFRVIIKYNGDIKKIEEWYHDTKVVLLFNQYAIVTTNARYLTEIARMPETVYIPYRYTWCGVAQCRSDSCCIFHTQIVRYI